MKFHNTNAIVTYLVPFDAISSVFLVEVPFTAVESQPSSSFTFLVGLLFSWAEESSSGVARCKKKVLKYNFLFQIADRLFPSPIPLTFRRIKCVMSVADVWPQEDPVSEAFRIGICTHNQQCRLITELPVLVNEHSVSI